MFSGTDAAPRRKAGHILRRMIWSRIVIAGCYAAGALVVLPLGLILGHLIMKGLPALSPSFFVELVHAASKAAQMLTRRADRTKRCTRETSRERASIFGGAMAVGNMRNGTYRPRAAIRLSREVANFRFRGTQPSSGHRRPSTRPSR